jgi:ferric-dicitrate binding protein FerR (iron transport regulator)
MDNFSEDSWEWLAGAWHREARGTGEPPVEEARSLLRDQFLIRRAMRRATGHAYDVERAWRKVTGGRRRAYRVVARAAASAAVVAGLLLAYYPRERDVARPAIVPGTARAELRLASGEVVSLEAHGVDDRWQGEGILLENDTSSGRLRYSVTGDDAPAAPRHNTLHVPKGGEYQLELPDGTLVWLNSISSIRFPERFAAASREVYLQGEAYFTVARDDRRPFRVHAGEQVITVTGTSFNVSAYDDDAIWRVTLVEGSIRARDGGREVVLEPSEQYVLDRRTGARSVEVVNSALYTSWVEGRFYFRAFTFDELVKKLERWYDFRMIYTDETIKNRRFTGFVNKHESIERMLTLLEMTTNIQFHVVDKTITVTTKPVK